MGASEDINRRLGQTECRPHLLSLSSTLPRTFYCSPEFEGPQMLTDWHVLLFIHVILLHLEQSV